MRNYQDLMAKVLEKGEKRNTRSGEVIGLFGENLEFDLRDGFPAITTKKLAFKSMVGELLWFLSGDTSLTLLKKFSGLSEDAWTIWTDDCERWHKSRREKFEPIPYIPNLSYDTLYDTDSLGKLYGHQWRSFEGYVDQIGNLIKSLQEIPESRYHIVSAWNPNDITRNRLALPACHTLFQCYVSTDGHLDLMWYQRSCDVFLGLPFNIASYALLSHIICHLTGLKPRMLKVTLGDVHVYSAHVEGALEQLSRTPKQHPDIKMPEFVTLDDLLEKTANDFQLVGYEHHPAIKVKLEVG